MAKKLLTNKNLTRLFGVSLMTIYNWAQGTPTREPLPAVREGRSVGYSVAKIRAWATKHEVAMTCDPESLLGTEVLSPSPKPKLVVVASAPKAAPRHVATPLMPRTRSG